jgi:hypothetical protein
MLSIEVLEKYEKDITQLDKSNIITPSKNTIAINSGIKGEAKVFEILKILVKRFIVVWSFGIANRLLQPKLISLH